MMTSETMTNRAFDSADLSNRRVTSAVAAEVSGVAHAAVRRLQSAGDLPAAPLSVGDSLTLAVAAELNAIGLSLPKATQMASSIGDDWRRVLAESDDVGPFELIAGPDASGVVLVAVATAAEVAALPVAPTLRVDLTRIARAVFEKVIRAQRAAKR